MRTGVSHRPWAYQDIHVFDRVFLRLDLEMEIVRGELYYPLIKKFGLTFKQSVHDGETPTFLGSHRCFDAAFGVASKFDLLYCEGLAIFQSPNGFIPIAHGFCCSRDGVVIDPTMPKYQGDTRVVYKGVPLKKDYVAAMAATTGFIGVLDGYPDGAMSPVFSDPPHLWLDTCN